MKELFVADLAGVGREAAQAVAGGNVVKEVEAKVGHDYEGDTVTGSRSCWTHIQRD